MLTGLEITELAVRIQNAAIFDLELFKLRRPSALEDRYVKFCIELILFDFGSLSQTGRSLNEDFDIVDFLGSVSGTFDIDRISNLLSIQKMHTDYDEDLLTSEQLTLNVISCFSLAVRNSLQYTSVQWTKDNVLTLYFTQRFSLMINRANSRNFTDLNAKTSQGCFFNYALFNLNKGSISEERQINSLIRKTRLSGHLFYLRYRFSMVKGDLLQTVSDLFTVGTVTQQFGDVRYRLNLLLGKKQLRRGLTTLDSLSIPFPELLGKKDSWLLNLLDAYPSKPSPSILRVRFRDRRSCLEIQKEAIAREQAIVFDAEDYEVVTPEDFLRTFVFFCPFAKVTDIELFLSFNSVGFVSPSNIPKKIFKSMDKFRKGWTAEPRVSSLREYLRDTKRIWANYEQGVAGVPRFESRVTFSNLNRDIEFVRLVWPKAKIILVHSGADSLDFARQTFDHLNLEFCDIANNRNMLDLFGYLKIPRTLRKKIFGLPPDTFFN